MSPTADTFFVLREGATQEEQWTRDEIAARCRNGEFGADTRIFFPDDNCWVRIEETDFQGELTEPGEEAEASESPEERFAREELEREYAVALEQVEDTPSSVDAHVDAGSLAAELGDREAARKHFQKALDLQPFGARVAQEARRRLTPAECRSLRLLERPAPVWDNLTEVLDFVLGAGWLYLALPAALFAGLLFLPGGGIVVAELAILWCYLGLRAAAAGRSAPPAWNRVRRDLIGGLLVPGAVMAAVSAQWLAVFWAFARVGMLVEHKHDIGAFAYIAGSPVLTIAIALCAVCYLPAVMVTMRETPRGGAASLLPWVVVRGMIRMELEYATSLLLLFAVAVVLGIVGVVTGGIPVAGKLVWAGSIAFVVPVAAFVLGRLRSRTAHLFEA